MSMNLVGGSPAPEGCKAPSEATPGGNPATGAGNPLSGAPGQKKCCYSNPKHLKRYRGSFATPDQGTLVADVICNSDIYKRVCYMPPGQNGVCEKSIDTRRCERWDTPPAKQYHSGSGHWRPGHWDPTHRRVANLGSKLSDSARSNIMRSEGKFNSLLEQESDGEVEEDDDEEEEE